MQSKVCKGFEKLIWLVTDIYGSKLSNYLNIFLSSFVQKYPVWRGPKLAFTKVWCALKDLALNCWYYFRIVIPNNPDQNENTTEAEDSGPVSLPVDLVGKLKL